MKTLFEVLFDKLPIWGWIIIIIVLSLCLIVALKKYLNKTFSSISVNIKGDKSVGIMNGGHFGNNITNNYYNTNHSESLLSETEYKILKAAYITNQADYVDVGIDYKSFLKAARRLKNRGYGSLNGFDFIINDKGREMLENEDII